jgi:hypothetical protein
MDWTGADRTGTEWNGEEWNGKEGYLGWRSLQSLRSN